MAFRKTGVGTSLGEIRLPEPSPAGSLASTVPSNEDLKKAAEALQKILEQLTPQD